MMIGKASIEEVKSLYKLKYLGPNKVTGGGEYDVDVIDVPFEGLASMTLAFDKEDVLHAVVATMPKDDFDYVFNLLKNKYDLLNSKIPFVETKRAKFVFTSGDVLLEALHMSFSLDVIYTTEKMSQMARDRKLSEKENWQGIPGSFKDPSSKTAISFVGTSVGTEKYFLRITK